MSNTAKWHRQQPGLYRTADGKWMIRRASEDFQSGNWLLFGPDQETGTEIWYGDYLTKAEAQEGAHQ